MSSTLRKAPRRWTAEEDSLLYREAMKQSPNSAWDWNRIAMNFTDRSNKDCRKRWVNRVSGGLKKGAWTEDEDNNLRKAVQNLGQRWTLVAEAVGCRSADQCAKRWQHHLDPKLDQREWTKDEDDNLLRAVREHGRSWKTIRDKNFPLRSRNDVKNRNTILTRRGLSLAPKSSSNQHTSEDDDSDASEAMLDVANDGNSDINGMQSRRDYETNNDGDRSFGMEGVQGSESQNAVDMDQFLSPFQPFDLSSTTGDMTHPELSSYLVSPTAAAAHVGVDQNKAFLPFELASNSSDLFTLQMESAVDHSSWSLPPIVTTAPQVPGDESPCSLDCPVSTPTASTYKRVTLVLEDYDKAAMNQLLLIISQSQGTSRIDITP